MFVDGALTLVAKPCTVIQEALYGDTGSLCGVTGNVYGVTADLNGVSDVGACHVGALAAGA